MKRKIWLLSGLIAFTYFLGIRIPVMDVDAAQYASMSRELLRRGNYLELYDQGKDYLDKPPFTFWISAASMAVFGVNNFADKLPSILFAFLAIYATYRFALLYYKRQIALLSSLVLATCQALFLITQDCRTDTILMGWTIFSIWQLAAYLEEGTLLRLIWGSLGIGMGMLTKGPVALAVAVLALVPHLAMRRDWKAFLRPVYLLGLLLIALLLLPMSVGLYQQFDLHPEKLVHGRHGVSGLGFFYWTQSFGRITGQSSWNNHAGIFFLLQNMFWSFLPWILFFLAGLVLDLRDIVGSHLRTPAARETITISGFLLGYLSLGMSRYQLPHYIFIVFPLAAVITAKMLCRLLSGAGTRGPGRLLIRVQYLIPVACLLVPWLILLYCFPPASWLPYGYATLASLGLAVLLRIRLSYPRVLVLSVYGMLTLNLFLSGYFYPRLLVYELGNKVGHWVQRKGIPAGKFYAYEMLPSHSLSFYSRRVVPVLDSSDSLETGWYILTDPRGLARIRALHYRTSTELRGRDYPVSLLSLPFLYDKTRDSRTSPYLVVRIQGRS